MHLYALCTMLDVHFLSCTVGTKGGSIRQVGITFNTVTDIWVILQNAIPKHPKWIIKSKLNHENLCPSLHSQEQEDNARYGPQCLALIYSTVGARMNSSSKLDTGCQNPMRQPLVQPPGFSAS
jgi:hypothetical protein